METSIRNARSLGVIPRAKIKTVKMTLVIVIGNHPLISRLSMFFSSSIYRVLVAVFSLDDVAFIKSNRELFSRSSDILPLLYEFPGQSIDLLVIRHELLSSLQVRSTNFQRFSRVNSFQYGTKTN